METSIFNNSIISKPKAKFNGFIMSKDTIVAKVHDNEIDFIDEILAPIYILRTQDFQGWLRSRSIDLHRTNSRLLRKMLRLNTSEEVDVVLKVNASTITDTYWVKAVDSDLTYKDIIFKQDLLSDLALFGDPNSYKLQDVYTPELTNIGSYEKCWKLRNQDWYMYKQGTDNEKFSELFAYELGHQLGFNMAEYELQGKYICTKDFTNHASINFEPMYAFIGDNEDYSDNIDLLRKIGNDTLLKQYLDIIFLDTIVMNVDRHTFNYGILRDVTTGDIISMAPNFDNNLSLISRGYPENIESGKFMVNWFLDALQNVKYELPKLDKEILECSVKKVAKQFDIQFNIDFISNFCMNSYNRLLVSF